MDRNQRAGLRGCSTVGRRDGLVAVAERRRNHHVELRFARCYRAGELDGSRFDEAIGSRRWNYKQLGEPGLKVSALSFGAGTFGGSRRSAWMGFRFNLVDMAPSRRCAMPWQSRRFNLNQSASGNAEKP